MSDQAIILACTDGSTYAPSVYDHAAWAAARLGAKIHVLHILDARREPVPHVDLSGSIGLNARQSLKKDLAELDEARGRAAQNKSALILREARAHFEQAGIENVRADARHGSLAATVESEESEAELVIIGKRGESADFETMHLGANLERVIRGCSHPVLVASRAFKPIERMVIAYDGGPSARKAIEYALSRPLLRGVRCILLAAGKPTAAIERELAEATSRLREAGFEAEARHETGHAEEVIAEAVRSEAADLLVMGAYGHSRVRQFIVGSTTTTMVRTCRVPVLMFR